MVNNKTLKSFIIDAIRAFDIETLNKTLENLKYQDFEKQKFLTKLENVFGEFRELGDTHLEIYDGKCNECNAFDSGFSFIGNISKTYIDLIIRCDRDKVVDIFECSNFKNDSIHLVKKGRQYLDDNPF